MDLITVGVSTLSLVISVITFCRAQAAVRSVKAFEQACASNIIVSLIDSYSDFSADKKILALNVSLANMSGDSNSIRECILRISYRTEQALSMKVSVPLFVRDTPAINEFERIRTPFTIKVNEVVCGWFYFCIDSTLFGNCKIDNYALVVIDAAGKEVELNHTIFRSKNV